MTQRTPAGIADPARRRQFTGPVLAAGALVLALVSVGCSEQMRQALSGPPDTPEELLTALRNDRARIDQTTDAMMRKIDTYNQGRKSGERTIQFSEVFMEDLTGDQRDVLNELLTQEQDVSYKALLQKMIADRDSIKGLQQKVLQLEQRLPDTFVVAKKGDRHSDLAMNYLKTEAQIDENKAKDLLSKVDRTDELVPGNHVWFFYDKNQDTFRTYVTQGEAGQTPLAVRRAKQRQLIAERDTYKTERDQEHVARQAAETEVASLETRKQQLESDISLLQQNKADLESNVDRLSKDLAFRQNSLFYHAEAEKSLQDKGVLSGVLARVKDVKGVQYDEALDLRQATSINLDPSLFGLEKINGVRLLPSIYQEGRDYSVSMSEENGTAQLMILDPDLFRGREVLLAVGG